MLFGGVPAEEAGLEKKCTMRGQVANAGTQYGKNISLPIYYPHAPVLLDGTDPIPLCDKFFNLTEPLCCDRDQLTTLKTRITPIEPFFLICPACLQNFVQFWCEYTCSPYQATFLTPTATFTEFNETLVNGTSVALHASYGEDIYNSCADVQYLGTSAITQLFANCNNYTQFWDDQGHLRDDGKGPPFPIEFTYPTDGGLQTDSLRNCSDSCTCANCEYSCPTPPAEKKTTVEKRSIFGHKVRLLEYYMIVASLAVTALGLVFIVLICIYRDAFERIQAIEPHKSTGGAMDGMASVQGLLIVPEDADGRAGVSTPDGLITGTGTKAMAIALDNSPIMHRGHALEKRMSRAFGFWGHRIATWPRTTILLAFVFTGLCAIGIKDTTFLTNPNKLWSAPDSRASVDEKYFDETFDPFYRIEQMIITPREDKSDNILRHKYLDEVLELQAMVQNLTVEYDGAQVGLTDLCYKPVLGKPCIVQTVLSYFWKDNVTATDWSREQCTIPVDAKTYEELSDADIVEQVEHCAGDQYDLCCRSSIGVPTDPNTVLGGFPGNSYGNATAVLVTYLLNNHVDEKDNAAAEAFEKQWLKIAAESFPNLDVAYMAQRSIEDEITRESSTDIPTVAISYAMMFLYVSVALGRISLSGGVARVFVGTKFMLGLGGIAIVLMALAISAGLCAAFGVQATLIISEVIPFLVLAIGVDNIFILVNCFEEETNSSQDVPTRVGLALASVGPSITLAALAESSAFMLGLMTKMPAVQAFAVYSAVAIFFDYLLQITCFVAFLTLDARRKTSNRIDCLPCIQLPRVSSKAVARSKAGFLRRTMARFYAPVLMQPYVKAAVVCVFTAMVLMGVSFATRVKLGLEQQVALPQDSYLQKYFADETKYLHIGPPAYLVVKEFDYREVEQQNKVCSVSKGDEGCHDNSLANVIAQQRLVSNSSYIKTSVSSWLDDYLTWMQIEGCYPGTTPFSPGTPCAELDEFNRPNATAFMDCLPFFMNTTCGVYCAFCGEAYASDVKPDYEAGTVTSRYRFYHTILKTQEDYVNALRSIYDVTEEVKKDNGNLPVLPYSIFYVFFEQYLTVVHLTFLVLGLSLAVVFAVCLFLLWNLVASLIVVFVIACIEACLFGVMALADISLNDISALNLVLCVGISIEFCVHITRAFVLNRGTRNERAQMAIADMGSSVISGIFLTKFIGVSVLAFSASDLFRVYYFRMLFAVVLLGCLHGLILLPVLLSILGPAEIAPASAAASKGDAARASGYETAGLEYKRMDTEE